MRVHVFGIVGGSIGVVNYSVVLDNGLRYNCASSSMAIASSSVGQSLKDSGLYYGSNLGAASENTNSV